MAANYFSNDTIAAIATSAAGDGGVGIIRISGPKALACAKKISKGFEVPKPRYLHRIEILNGEQVLDDGLGAYFPEKQSFTGEEVIELQLHGGRFLLQTILKLLIETAEARLALPGEFSFRAVRNGKLSLSGASAIKQLISAQSLFEIQAARRNLSEKRFKELDGITEKIRNLLAQTELSIDFADQDVEVISVQKLKDEVSSLIAKTDLLLRQMRAAQRIALGLKVSLVGEPNAGKSTLFNALLSEDRAIVSPEAGTTRDVITEDILVGPYRVRLADTAGLRDSEHKIEREGIERAQTLLRESALVLLVTDAIKPLPELKEIAQMQLNSNQILVLNKADLLNQKQKEEIIKSLPGGLNFCFVSAFENWNIEELVYRIQAALDTQYSEGLISFLPTEFQLQMLIELRKNLMETKALSDETGLRHPELLSANLMRAARALSDFVGETTPDTVLTKIFSEFCIGK